MNVPMNDSALLNLNKLEYRKKSVFMRVCGTFKSLLITN